MNISANTTNRQPKHRVTRRKKASLANQIQALLNRGRAIYSRKDELFQELLKSSEPGEIIETKNGRFVIVDNFSQRNVGFRPAMFHRYELKELKGGLPSDVAEAA